MNLKDAGSSDTTEGYFNEGENMPMNLQLIQVVIIQNLFLMTCIG